MKKAPRVLVIAGLDPSGRAGLLADVATVRGQGGVALGVVSALTAQGATTFRVERVQPRMLREQLRAVLENGHVDCVKLGMIPDRAALETVRRALEGLSAPWVVDPVVRSSRGGVLSKLWARDYLGLAAKHVVLTPNVAEASWLLGDLAPETLDPAAAAAALAAEGFGAVVLKGGHLPGPAVDFVASAGKLVRLAGPRLRRSAATRGTGCRFASAFAVEFARGRDAFAAARAAKRAVRGYLADS